jgi:hypothetical protein
MTFTGTIANINTALGAGVSFNPTASFTGTATLQIVTSDLGNTGTGGTLTDTDSLSITVVSAYQTTILGTTGLVNYYRLGESSGTTITDLKSANNGTYVSTPTLGVAGRTAADTNTATLFNGSSYGTITSQVQNDFSVEFWFKAAAGTGTSADWYDGASLIDNSHASATTSDWGSSLRSDGKITFGIGNTNTTIITSSGGYANNAWHHVVLTRAASTGAMVIYVDGAQAATGTGPTAARTAVSTIGFGAHAQDHTQPLNGSLDEISFYSVVLAPATVTAHRSAGL